MTSFQAYRLTNEDGAVRGGVTMLNVDDLSVGDVLIRTAYASVNYKDALAAAGRNRIIRNYPRIGGIDLTGTVAHSDDRRFRSGDEVVVHGFGIGVDHDGGYAGYARVPGDWVMPLPQGLSLREAATVGVAGYTAALSIHLMELNGLVTAAGRVAVNGATGGAASLAIDMLSGRGYAVVAMTRKTEARTYLLGLGAADVLPAPEPDADARPLEPVAWAGAIDSVGDGALASLIRRMQPGGVIAAFGNAGGNTLECSVLPFILRGVRLIGVNANSAMPERQKIWARIASDLKPRHLDQIATEIGLDTLDDAFACLLDGSGQGRFLVALQE